MLNVAAGGTLVQDIPSAVPSDLAHSITQPRDTIAHEVRIASESRLRGAWPGRRCLVHMPRQQPASPVRRDARPRTGCVGYGNGRRHRGIEMPVRSFCVGVQWHPENFWRTGEFGPLFDAFVAAARRRMESSR